MSGKNQKAVQRKQAKAKARDAARKSKEHQAEQTKFAAQRKARAQADQQLSLEIATKGILAVAQDLATQRKGGKKSGRKFTNVGILKMITETIPVFAHFHGLIEVADRLHTEKKITLTTEQLLEFAGYDRAVVGITEDINAMYDFIEVGKKPDDYMEIFTHYIDLMAEVMQLQIPSIYGGTMNGIKPLVDAFVKEHTPEDVTMVQFSYGLHEIRMNRVADQYRTGQTVHADMTAPLGGELVEEDDVDADVAIELAKNIHDPVTC